MSMFMCTDERTLGELRTLSPSFNVGIVPFPQFDSDGTYYVRAVSEGFLVPKGAKNIRNAASFINCSRIAETSDDGINLSAAATTSSSSTRGYVSTGTRTPQ